MATQTSPLNGKQVRYDNIEYIRDKTKAEDEMGRHRIGFALCGMKLELHLQFVGAQNAWIIEGHYKSNPYVNPYVLRTDGVFRQLHTDKIAKR